VKEIKGKTLVRLDIDSETEIIRDDHTGVFVGAYQTKQIGSLLVATNIRKENANAFDPVCGEVVSGEHKGMTAWFHKLNFREAKSYGNQNHLFQGVDIGETDGTYMQINDNSIFFYTDSNGKIHMTEEWCLCEPIGDVTWEYVDGIKIKCRSTTGGLIIPALKEDYKTNKAVLSHINPVVAEELGLSEGYVVFLDRACDLPVEDELNMKLGKIYFRVEVCNILGVEPKEDGKI
jgi:hypothetical protein